MRPLAIWTVSGKRDGPPVKPAKIKPRIAIPGLPAKSDHNEHRDPRIDEQNKAVVAELEKLGLSTISDWVMDKGEAAGVILCHVANVEQSPCHFHHK